MSDIIIASKREAEDRAERIRTALSVSWDLIKDAWKAFDWQALGYQSWDAYCDGEFGTSRIRLPREERREVVSSMREIGMPIRAIASATGTNRETVRQEVAGDKKLSPETVTGMDGKTYSSSQPERPRATAIPQSDLDALNTPPAPEPDDDEQMPEWENVAQLPPQAVQQMQQQKPKRRPLTDEALRAVLDLNRAVDRLRRITEDDRFTENRRRIREQSLSDLQRADNTIHDTITDLEKD